MLEHFAFGDVVPDREDDLTPFHLASEEAVQLGFRPVLGEKAPGQNDHAVFGSCQPFVNLLAEAVTDFQSPFVIPDTKAKPNQFGCEWTDKIVLVLAGVGDKDVEADGR